MNNIFSQIEQFKRMLGNKDPQQMLNELINSGKVTQEQIEEAKKKAEMLMGMFR